uniref:Uncharacterized protein n=1 Tax=viral metagenome TaxID=1070528 RepID=A0A6C0DA38_9ZZZZ
MENINIQSVTNLKNKFAEILKFRSGIHIKLENLDFKITKLKEIYHKFVSESKTEVSFGLDSLYFQGKLINIELTNMKSYYKLINNRMYCVYYKLYKLIVDYINKNLTEKKIVDLINISNYPVYKDLEPYKDYDFNITTKIHNNIIDIINALIDTVGIKIEELNTLEITKNNGININNYINSYRHKAILIKEQTFLFINYMEFLNMTHYNYHQRFFARLTLLTSQIDSDIDFDDKNNNAHMQDNLINDLESNSDISQTESHDFDELFANKIMSAKLEAAKFKKL